MILERLNILAAAVEHLSRLHGARLTRADVCSRLEIHRNTPLPAGFPPPMRDGKWLLADWLEWERKRPEPAPLEPLLEPTPSDRTAGAQHLYRHFDADGVLLYVGISVRALNRLVEHSKDAHWYWRIARVEITAYSTRADALLAERLAIQREKPLHNVIHAVAA